MKKATCDCIQKNNIKLSEKMGKRASINQEMYSGCVLINFCYETLTKNGKSKLVESSIMPKYCPFCGKEYINDGKDSENNE